MPRYQIKLETKPSKKDLAFVRKALRRFNLARTGPTEVRELTVFARSSDGTLIGACLGEAYWGWLHIDILWISEAHRGEGLGKKLLAITEREGNRSGCHSAYLDTFEFQARPFYEKCGYKVFGVLKGFPPPHERYYMKKKLSGVRRKSRNKT